MVRCCCWLLFVACCLAALLFDVRSVMRVVGRLLCAVCCTMTVAFVFVVCLLDVHPGSRVLLGVPACCVAAATVVLAVTVVIVVVAAAAVVVVVAVARVGVVVGLLLLLWLPLLLSLLPC